MRLRSAVLAVAALLAPLAGAVAQTRIVTGKVADSLTSEAVTSGQVTVQGTSIGSTIKDDGTFTLAVPARDVTLTVRSIGFKRQTVTVPASESSIQVSLARDFFQLEAIVVTGQATGIERRNLANAVATVSAEQLTKSPTSSVEQSLQGKMAGAMITQNSGAPGGGMIVRLRGVTSIIGAYTPLYVVDGVIASDVSVPPGTNFISQATPGTTIATAQENQMNRIGDLNPNDIENVEVLKGASAAAIYGSKAANGVIIITTKRGRVGVPQFTLSQKFGISQISKQVGARRFSAGDTAGVRTVWGQPGVNAFIAANGLTTPDFFDHELEVFGNKPLSHETSASVSGGTEDTRYFASGLVKHDAGIMTRTFADKQALRLNLDQTVGRVTIGISSGVNRTYDDRGLVNNENNGSTPYTVFSTTPTFYDLRAVCPDGSRKVRCERGVYPVNEFGNANALHTAEIFENLETVWRFLGAGKMIIDAVKTGSHTLRLVTNAGADFFGQKNNVFSPPTLQFEAVDGLLGTSVVSVTNNLNLNLNTNLVHVYRSSGGTSATTQAGFQYETYDLTTDRMLGANLVGGLNAPFVGTVTSVDNRRAQGKDLGGFAQEEFLTLGERLLLTLGVRADRSSNNADPDQIFAYPKAAASFRFPRGLAFVNELKLRAAAGASGNQPLYGQAFTELKSFNISGVPATAFPFASGAGVPTGAADLRPERQVEIEAGFDATMLGSRANLEFTVFEKRVSDLLIQRTLPSSDGFTSQIFNGGTLRTRGLEASLAAVPLQSREVQWNTRVNFWLNRCKITSLPVPPFPASGIRKEAGKSCTQFWGNDSLGRLPDDAALGTIGTRIVRYLVDINPRFNLSFANDFSFHAFKLYGLVEHQNGGYRSFSTYGQFDGNQNSIDYVTPLKPGQLTGTQRRALSTKCTRCNTLRPSNYVKLREVSLSVQVPNSLVRKFWSGSRYVRLNLTGRNLLTITPYPGTDPESVQTPNSLASSTPSEFLGYPVSRSVWFSIDLGL